MSALKLLYWKGMILLSKDTARNFENLDRKDTKAQVNSWLVSPNTVKSPALYPSDRQMTIRRLED